MSQLWFSVIGIFFCVHTTLSWNLVRSPPVFDHKVSLPTNRPLVIAHRGSSGVLPEETVEAYQLAVDEGADIIECDIVMTKDLRLVCIHDHWINSITNVADLFPDRITNHFIPNYGLNITDYFTIDFTVSELKTLRVKQSFDIRNQEFNGLYQIATVEEFIDVAKRASRPVGLCIEAKQSEWVNSLPLLTDANTSMEKLLVQILSRYGYSKKTDPCILQSFNYKTLDNLRALTDLPLVYLLFAGIPTEDEIKEWSRLYYGISPSTSQIAEVGPSNNLVKVNNVIEMAHRYGLKVHPWTFRNENQYLLWEYGQDPYEEMALFLNLGVDGYITDFPKSCVAFLDKSYSECSNAPKASHFYHLGMTVFACLLKVIIFNERFIY